MSKQLKYVTPAAVKNALLQYKKFKRFLNKKDTTEESVIKRIKNSPIRYGICYAIKSYYVPEEEIFKDDFTLGIELQEELGVPYYSFKFNTVKDWFYCGKFRPYEQRKLDCIEKSINPRIEILENYLLTSKTK